MLSDACSDFNYSIRGGKPVKEAATVLLKDIEWYSRPSYDYPPQHIGELRRLAEDVIANPDNSDLANRLTALADAIRADYDRVPA